MVKLLIILVGLLSSLEAVHQTTVPKLYLLPKSSPDAFGGIKRGSLITLSGDDIPQMCTVNDKADTTMESPLIPIVFKNENFKAVDDENEWTVEESQPIDEPE